MLKKSRFYNVKLILFMNNFYKHHFRKQPFANVLQNKWSEKISQNSELKRDSNKSVFA